MTTFAVTWDYRCPFARNVSEHILAGLAAGADWDVHFVPFSLGQVHVEDGQPDVWDEPSRDKGILALQAGVVARDRFPNQFPAVHGALFATRHDEGLHLEDQDVIREVLRRHQVDDDEIFAAVSDGSALEQIRKEHESVVESHNVWGVPTFLRGDRAAFVRLMNRPDPAQQGKDSIRAIERCLDLIDGWPDLNEFKHTSIPK